MPSYHRRTRSVKPLPPRRLLEGLRPSVAIPSVLFAALLIGAIAIALHKAPVQQKWLKLRDYPGWRPALNAAGGLVPYDERFVFERPLERALTPRATTRRAPELPPVTADGEVLAAAALRVVSISPGSVVVEYASGRGEDRRIVRGHYSGLGEISVVPGAILQRGETVGRIIEGSASSFGASGSLLGELPAASWPAPELREITAGAPSFSFGEEEGG